MPFTNDEELLTEREVGQHTKRSRRQLQRDRANRRGIPFVQLENQIRYRLGDVRAYVARNLRGLEASAGESITERRSASGDALEYDSAPAQPPQCKVRRAIRQQQARADRTCSRPDARSAEQSHAAS